MARVRTYVEPGPHQVSADLPVQGCHVTASHLLLGSLKTDSAQPKMVTMADQHFSKNWTGLDWNGSGFLKDGTGLDYRSGKI